MPLLTPLAEPSYQSTPARGHPSHGDINLTLDPDGIKHYFDESMTNPASVFFPDDPASFLVPHYDPVIQTPIESVDVQIESPLPDTVNLTVEQG